MFYALLIFFALLFALHKISQRVTKAWQKAALLIASLPLFYLYNLAVLKNCPGDCAIRVDLLLSVPVLIAFIIAGLRGLVKLKRAQ
jgi:hypothetical protein